MKDSSISIIVPCYNSEKTIKQCIESIELSISNYNNRIVYELIVVDDGSTDQTAKLLQSIKNIQILTHKKNKGLSCARNSGVKASSHPLIAFIDSDILIDINWFNNLLPSIEKNKNIIGVTGGLLSPQKSLTLLEKYLFSSYRGPGNISPNQPLKYKWFVFSNTIIKKKALAKVGFFDEKIIFYGGEDTELAIRIDKSFPGGLRQNSQGVGYHICNKSLKQYLNNIFEYGLNNFIYIIKKHPSYKTDLGYNVISSFWGYFVFNAFTRILFSFFFLKLLRHPIIIKFLVVEAFVRGVRQSNN